MFFGPVESSSDAGGSTLTIDVDVDDVRCIVQDQGGGPDVRCIVQDQGVVRLS